MSHGFMSLAFMSEEWYVAYPIALGYIAITYGGCEQQFIPPVCCLICSNYLVL